MRFTNVVFDTDGETTICTKEANTSLFESRSVASIYRDVEQKGGSVSPTTISVSNGSYLAISTSSEISFFELGADIQYKFTQIFKDDVNVIGMEWLAKSKLLAVVSSAADFYLIWPPSESIVYSTKLDKTSRWCHAVLCSEVLSDICSMVVSTDTSEVIRVDIPHWEDISSASNSTIVSLLDDSLSQVDISKGRTPAAMADTLMTHGTGMIGVTPSHSSFLSATHIDFDYLEGDLCTTSNGFVRVREVCSGRFLAALSVDSCLVFYDSLTHIQFFSRRLCEKGERVVDFFFTDASLPDLAQSNIALIVEKKDCAELQIRTIDTNTVCFASGVSCGSCFVELADTERVAMLVEPFDARLSLEDQRVRIREVTETQTQHRLERLLARGLIDEAEKFAKKHGLDLQKVYVARMNHLLNFAVDEDDNGKFDAFIDCLKYVKDDNLVGDTCLAAATMAIQLPKIIAFIENAKKKTISDSDTHARLLTVSYNLATYRMIFGVNASFSSSSSWSNFLDNSDWHSEWLTLLRGGLVSEATLLWHRYEAAVCQPLKDVEEGDNELVVIRNMFTVCQNVFNEYEKEWESLIFHLENDVIPSILSVEPLLIMQMFCNFLVSIAENIEYRDQAAFPDNALHAASTVERMMEKMSRDALTPHMQAKVAFYATTVSPITSKLSERVRSLQAIKKLLTVYECPMSYDQYINSKTEEICFKILQKAVQNPAHIKANIEKFARPYMVEHNLDTDRTLFNYIESTSSLSRGTALASNPWDTQCLLVNEAISKPGLRAKAVALIAKGAHPPWRKELKEAVEGVLSDPLTDPNILQELTRVCQKAELGIILMAHSIIFEYVGVATRSELSFIQVINAILADKATNLQTRLANAHKAAEIAEKLTNWTKAKKSIYALYVETIVDEGESLEGVHSFLDSLEEGDREEAVDQLIDHLFFYEEQFSASPNSEAKMHVVETMRSLIMRYRRDDRQRMLLYEGVGCIATLYKRYSMFVALSDLEDKKLQLQRLIDYSQRKQRSAAEVYNLAAALGISREEASCAFMDMALQTGDMSLIIDVVKDSISRCGCPSESLLMKMVECIQFVLAGLGELKQTEDESQIVVELVESISRVLSMLISESRASEKVEEILLRMSAYTSFFMAVVKQLESEEEMDTDQRQTESVRCTYAMSRRVGVYDPSGDNPIFNKVEAISHVSAVARTFIVEYTHKEIRDRDCLEKVNEHVEEKWAELFHFLSIHCQSALEISGKVLYTSAKLREPPSGLTSAVHALCERLLAGHPCDLFSIASLLALIPPATIQHEISDLHRWVSSRRSPQTTINFLRVVQFFSLYLDVSDLKGSCSDLFTKALWQKKLRKLGVATNGREIGDKLNDFADATLSPHIVQEFVQSHYPPDKRKQGRAIGCMNIYAKLLILKACSGRGSIDKQLLFAEEALRIENEKGENMLETYDMLRETLDQVCPYAYEVICFVLDSMSAILPFLPQPEKETEFVRVCRVIYEFLANNPRMSALTREEHSWYIEWERNTRPNANESLSMSKLSDDGERKTFYERDEVFLSALHPKASTRLPFHVFLIREEEVLEKSFVPIVYNEINIYTQTIWSEVRRKVPWLARSDCIRDVNLVTQAVIKKSSEVAAKGEKLDDDEIKQIEKILNNVKKYQLLLLQKFATNVRKLPLGPTKIQFFEMGLRLALKWLEEPNELKDSEQRAIEDQVNRINEAISHFKTEFLLKQKNLYNDQTQKLESEQLIAYLYTNCINWNDPKDCEDKMAIMHSLAEYNNVCLEEMHDQLIERWIPDEDVHVVDVDMDDTMGGSSTAFERLATDVSDDDVFALPYFNDSITRIVHLVKLCSNRETIARNLILKIRMDTAMLPGGYRTKIRSLCILLRAFDEDFIQKVLERTTADLSAMIKYMHYSRLLETPLGRDKVDTALNMPNKVQLIKNLLQSTNRQISTTCACLVLDYSVCDRMIVECLLTRLHSGRKHDLLATLLKFCRDHPSLRSVKHLDVYWGRTLDWALGEYDSSPSLRGWLFFSLSCPVEGRRVFDSCGSSLSSRGLLLAAHAFAIAASYTSLPPPPSLSSRDPRDLSFQWLHSSA